jgi:hypothetical protein
MGEAIRNTRDHAYAHHIQRLMVTGNFALIAGLSVEEVCAWYLAVYVDAYEWVELPNTLGMALFADGGLLASKPYCASGKYIDRMSDYCRGCHYDVKRTVGTNACPLNTLYWDFLMRHASRFQSNPRMAMILKNIPRMSADKASAIQVDAQRFNAHLAAHGDDLQQGGGSRGSTTRPPINSCCSRGGCRQKPGCHRAASSSARASSSSTSSVLPLRNSGASNRVAASSHSSRVERVGMGSVLTHVILMPQFTSMAPGRNAGCACARPGRPVVSHSWRPRD